MFNQFTEEIQTGKLRKTVKHSATNTFINNM